jgi:hypothetical protein
MLRVNTEQSRAVGRMVKKIKMRSDFLNRPFLTVDLHDELKSAMYLISVGICHQTYKLANNKLNLYGWDFLEYAFMQIAKNKPELLNVQIVSRYPKRQLIEEIKPFFSENHSADDCTLDRLNERIDLWIDASKFINERFSSALDFINKSNNNSEYFYTTLQSVKAYTDPLRKKTSFLLKILDDAGLIHINQNADLIPIMDYHMQRIMLRTACISIENTDLQYALKNRKRLNDDFEIRKACIEAMKIISDESGKSVFKMNDIFYTLGRSCCNNEPLCFSGHCEKNPCTLSLATEIERKHKCILESVCKGFRNRTYASYWQPNVETNYY